MRLPAGVKRPAYKVAYVLLCVYWLVARPSTNGVKCVLIDADRLLLVRHTYGPRRWDLPGGGVKRHEPPAATARREIHEELGLDIDDWTPLGTFTARNLGRLDHIHCFTADITGAQIHPDRGEIAEIKWFGFESLPPKLGEYVKPVLAALAR